MLKNSLVLIIQARMNSTRLPHKVIIDLCGAPLIERILQRVKVVKKIGTIIIATTKKKMMIFWLILLNQIKSKYLENQKMI